MKKNIVVFGGGNGSANTLVALKQNLERYNIDAIITVSDSGGSSGRLRNELGVLPPGDIMRGVLALSIFDYSILKKIFFQNRFKVEGKLNKHNLGNLFLALSEKYGGSSIKAIRALEESVEAVGRVHPVTLKAGNLVAKLNNGKIIKSEAKIDEPEYDLSFRIKNVYLEPKLKANPEAVKAVLAADYIIISSGSLYTSIVASLLPIGIKEAIDKSDAKIIFVSGNAYHLYGETGPKVLSEIVSELELYLPRKIDYILYNKHKLNTKEKEHYKKKTWGVFENDSKNLLGRNVIAFDFSRPYGGLSSIKLGKKLKELIK